MDERQRKTYHQSRHVRIALVLARDSQNDQNEDEGEECLRDECLHCRTLRVGVGSRQGGPFVYACGYECVDDGRADDGSDDLEQHVHAGLLALHPAGKPYTERNGRIDVAARNVPYRVGHGYHGEAEGQCDAERAYARSHDTGDVP